MSMFDLMKKRNRWILLSSILAVLIIAVFSYITVRYKELSDFELKFRTAYASDATWGTIQLGQDVMRFELTLHDLIGNPTEENVKALSIRNDLLYSRVDVVSLAISNNAAYSTKFKNNVVQEFAILQGSYDRIDELTQKYIKTQTSDDLFVIERLLDEMVPKAVQLASKLNQHIKSANFKIQERTLQNMQEYQILLMLIFVVFLSFSVFSLLLYRKVYNVNSTLALTAKDLNRANDAKTHFMSSMSHELRTPLNAIIGFTQILEMGKNQYFESRRAEYCGYILSSANLLLNLINQILDLEKIESGKVEFNNNDFELNPLLDDCFEMSRPLATKYKVQLENNKSVDYSLFTDDMRLRQILLNFISNGIKYNQPGGKVTLKCALTDHGSVLISIIDNGLGIPQEKRSFLFQPFERLGREAQNIEGTGIGLNISHSIATHLGYEIGYTPNPTGGSIFWLEVPEESVKSVH